MSTLFIHDTLLYTVVLTIAIVANVFLAVAVYRSDTHSATNRIFALLTLCTTLWLVDIYVVRQPLVLGMALLFHRFGIVVAALMSAFFFLLAHTLPSPTLRLHRGWLWCTIVSTALVAGINASPYAFVGVHIVDGVPEPLVGVGMIPFSVLSTFFSLLACLLLARAYWRATGVVRKQIRLVLIGVLVMLTLIIVTILVPLVFFNSMLFLPLSPLYSLVFLALTAYAITTYQLFNIKVILTQALVVMIELILFAKMFGEESMDARVVDGGILLAMLVIGFFLVRSVKNEVRSREQIEHQEKELEVVNTNLQDANRNQENLIHFIAHEVKGYFGKSLVGFTAIAEEDYGPISPALKKLATQEREEMHTGLTTVTEILGAASFKKGLTNFTMQPFDLKTEVQRVFEDVRPSAEGKGLQYTLVAPEGSYMVMGDPGQLGNHVIHNLIDNAVRYTPTGSITIRLERDVDVVRVVVADSGVGILPADMQKLFTEGGRGTDSLKINPHSTGYGLFIVKSIVEAHHGRVYAQSRGSGTGSTFIVEIPALGASAAQV